MYAWKVPLETMEGKNLKLNNIKKHAVQLELPTPHSTDSRYITCQNQLSIIQIREIRFDTQQSFI